MHNAQLPCTEQQAKSDCRDDITNIDALNAENTDKELHTCTCTDKRLENRTYIYREEVCFVLRPSDLKRTVELYIFPQNGDDPAYWLSI